MMMRRNVLAGPNEIYVVVRQVLTMVVPTTTTYDVVGWSTDKLDVSFYVLRIR